MASVVKLGSGKQPPRAIDYTDPCDGKRKRIRLGIVGGEDAAQVCRLVEKVVACKSLNRPLDVETLGWLSGLSDEIHRRIAEKGLTQPRNPAPTAPTLRAFVAKYIDQRKADLKPASIKRLDLTRKVLVAHFGEDVRLDAITADAAADWRATLAGSGFSEATVRLECRNAKSIFGDAVRRELLPRNLFAALKSSGHRR